jgi:hypothetical protein
VPRPCHEDHPLSPLTCRMCLWSADDSDLGAFYRRLWGEPEPGEAHRGAFADPRREIVPGLLDPIQEPALQPAPERWPHDPRVIRRHRDALYKLAQPEMPPCGVRRGKGVLLVGGGKYWPGIVVAVKMLRDTGSTLPVQIWHRGSQEPVRRDDLAGIAGVEIHDLTTIAPPSRMLGGWEAKTVALLACGWERILYLDADAYCVADPAWMLDRLSSAEPFLFWADFPNHGGAVNWSVWGLGPSDLPSIQGGHFAIHFTHFWREFVLAHWLNQHSDFSYAHQYGDQDSWRVALRMTGGDYRCLGPARWDSIAFVCNGIAGPLVVHRCQAKMLWAEDVTPGDWQSNRRLDRLPGEARAWAHFEELLSARAAPEVFGFLYLAGHWGPGECSGAGSAPREARPYLDIVNGLAKLSGWRRLVDLGCGDGWVTSRLELAEVVGVDCHGPHVERLRGEFPEKEWLHLDLDRDRDRLPAGDVAFLKDVLHHWPNRLVRDWLTWARTCGKWRWLVCTQDRHQAEDDQDCPLGGYRGLDPALAPLRGLGLVPFCEYLHKSVLLLPIQTAIEMNG